MSSIAITDHGCMFGVIEFYNECKKQGVKPIIGMEAYMAPGDRRERSTPGGNAGEAAYHLLLLAENLEGYQNLLRAQHFQLPEKVFITSRASIRKFSRELRQGSDRDQCVPRRGNSVGIYEARCEGREEGRGNVSRNLWTGSLFHRGAKAGDQRAGHRSTPSWRSWLKSSASDWSRPMTCTF